MYQLTEAAQSVLNEYEADYRTKMHDGKYIAEIIDRNTGEIYVTAEGDDSKNAVENAVAKIPSTPKPLTRAQKLTVGELSAKDAEIKRLQAELDKLKAKPAKKGKKGDAVDATNTPPASDEQGDENTEQH